MRPVTKGAQAPYAPVVDMSSQANLDTSLGNITLTFGGKAQAPIKGVWGTSKPTALRVLNGLLMIVKADAGGLPPPKKKAKTSPTVDQVRDVKDTVDSNLANVYRSAFKVLEGQLGRFCSYCEMFTSANLAVEHITPKAPYPLFYLAWDNFLLSCSVCNSNKLSLPKRDNVLFTPTPADEVGYDTKIDDFYLWPQRYQTVYRSSKPRLEYYSQAQKKWIPVAHPEAVGTILRSSDDGTRTHLADVLVNAKGGNAMMWRLNVPVQVTVTEGTPRAEELVRLLKLNKASSNEKNDHGDSDIRVWTRTKRWFDVLGAMRLLQNATAATFPDLWSMMLPSIEQPGLYSLWVTVIDLLGPNRSWLVPGTNEAVMDKFLTLIVGKGYFPGTDTANTP